MATILFAWELGGGLGHITQLGPLASALAALGHRVYAALRELGAARQTFDPRVALLQAPFRATANEPLLLPPPSTFAEMIGRLTFADEQILDAHAQAWRSIYDLTRPDAIIFDHSPTALLAARGLKVRRGVIGTGFTVPPSSHPMPAFRPRCVLSELQLAEAEDAVVARAGPVLDRLGAPPLRHLGQLYGEVDRTFLATFAELDPYRRSQGTSYCGPANAVAAGGRPPQWPDRAGKRVFAYLKPFPVLPELLDDLKRRGLPTLIFMSRIDPHLRARFECATLRFVSERVDLERVARECAVAISNGTHATAAAMLLAGRPALHLPLHPEQGLTARAVRRMGAGRDASVKDAGMAVGELSQLLSRDMHTDAARAFAARHARFDARQQVAEIVRQIDELIA